MYIDDDAPGAHRLSGDETREALLTDRIDIDIKIRPDSVSISLFRAPNLSLHGDLPQ